jgi:hypothetical protein
MDEKAHELAAAMREFADEACDNYLVDQRRGVWGDNRRGWGEPREASEPSKPSKFVLALSHLYTPLSLHDRGAAALKGGDRGIGDLILRAQHLHRHCHAEVPSLEKLAAMAVVDTDPPGYGEVPVLLLLLSRGRPSPFFAKKNIEADCVFQVLREPAVTAG